MFRTTNQKPSMKYLYPQLRKPPMKNFPEKLLELLRHVADGLRMSKWLTQLGTTFPVHKKTILYVPLENGNFPNSKILESA